MISILFYVGITILAFAAMEFIAWFTHKYIMHGILWTWHRDHHQPHHKKDGFFERNDLFFLVFAIPSALFYFIGMATPHLWALFAGIGISLYGLAYFLIHDVYIHRRFKWFKQLDNKYSRAVLRAHGRHHAKQTKEDCESFGLLVVDSKYSEDKKTSSRTASN